MAKSLCCPPETITTLLIGYTPIQKKKVEGGKNRGRKEHSSEGVLPNIQVHEITEIDLRWESGRVSADACRPQSPMCM